MNRARETLFRGNQGSKKCLNSEKHSRLKLLTALHYKYMCPVTFLNIGPIETKKKQAIAVAVETVVALVVVFLSA